MTNCVANSVSPYLPLASAGIGFLGALFLYFLKERIDLKGRRREAIYFLLFFTNTLKKMISVDALPARAGGNFEESIRKLASAQLEYYDWPEVAKLADMNASWVAGEYSSLVHKKPVLSELQTILVEIETRAKSY